MTGILFIPLPGWWVEADKRAFQLINSGLANSFFDFLLPYTRNAYVWAPLYLFFLVFMLINFRRAGWWWILFFLLTFSCTDLTGTHLFKNIFERLRPCNDPEMEGMVRLVINKCGKGFSFISNHAINHFGLAAFIYNTFKNFFRESWLFFIWAAVIAFAQVYVGIHYPSDVLAGAFLGTIIGFTTANIFNKRFGFHIFE